MSARSDVLLWAQRVIGRKGKAAHELLEIRANATAGEAQEAFHKIARSSHPDLHRNGLNAEELELVTRAYATCAGAYQAMRMQATQRIEIATSARPTQQIEPTKPNAGTTQKIQPITSSRPTQQIDPIEPNAGTTQKIQPITSSRPTQRIDQRSLKADPIATSARPTQRIDQRSLKADPIATSARPTQQIDPITSQDDDGAPTPAMSSKAVNYYRKAEGCLNRGDLKGAVLQIKLAIAADPTSAFLRTALAQVEAEVRKTT